MNRVNYTLTGLKCFETVRRQDEAAWILNEELTMNNISKGYGLGPMPTYVPTYFVTLIQDFYRQFLVKVT